ncbi:Adenosylhomocysteinase (S-adenosyl-L-homocysteine hydrolase) [Bartonella clarridgeiae 73]|uniref:Adenosylhomocysteinase (S-adenosyl-L-homocysteine hydrolase) n=1 Tax=Bartonella clarridgeiae (strain CCUG 45776 / CIP 104772 / 73) TaxID=696125 RepID=E6YFT1_BARC7|nr:adenosylhomocysteinase [Bartonella clarridgeiae]WCR55670.1 MAG: Adenosylhomocysteinase [Bartonella clarridgeiae]CBI75719.1 Adenosylhomocysteinase (S-adenosyl-L-homocysteine hydrolase) [Bartonella clarridgeiae 73]
MAAQDYVIKDIALATYSGKVDIAEMEMPGLMACHKEFFSSQPLRGACISSLLHMTIQIGVLIEILKAIDADIRWSSNNIFSTQNHAAAAGTTVFIFKGETFEEYWIYIDAIFQWPDDKLSNLILDDGNDATNYVLIASCVKENKDILSHPTTEEEEFFFKQIQKRITIPGFFTRQRTAIKGVSKETITEVHHLDQLQKKGLLFFPAINVNDSVTKSKFDNKYGCKKSLVDIIRHGTDLMIAGKIAIFCGYDNVGKGSAASLSDAGARVKITEIDPICPFQAAMNGYEAVTLEDAASSADTIITTTGNKNIVRLEHMRQIKNICILGNIGHFDNKIHVSAPRNLTGTNIKSKVDMITFPEGKHVILLSEGRLLNLGNSTVHPSFIMSASFTDKVLAQIELFTNAENYKNEVMFLPKYLDEKVAGLHFDRLGIKLSVLSEEKAAYIGISPKEPYKSDHYRY